MEIVQANSFHRPRPNLYFWRTSNGAEVDIVVADGLKLIPIEAKMTATPKMSMGKGLKHFQDIYGEEANLGYLIYSGDMLLPVGHGNIALPMSML